MTLPGYLMLSIAVVAALTATATAVRSVSRIWLRHWVERRLAGALTAELYLARPQQLLLAATTAVAMTVFVAGVLIGAGSASGWPIRLAGIATYAIALLLLGQLIPRAVARRWPSVVIPPLLPILRALELVLMPLLKLTRRLTGEAARDERLTQRTDAEGLAELLREGVLEGVGEHAEIAIIEGVVQFGAKTLRDVMTPRESVFAIELGTPAQEVARAVAASGYSRVPVYERDLDHVQGMIHAFDILRHGPDRLPRQRPIAMALPDAPCNDTLFRMLRDRLHLAVIRGHDNRVVGIVTMEDLLEELVGDIRDEHDEPRPERAPA